MLSTGRVSKIWSKINNLPPTLHQMSHLKSDPPAPELDLPMYFRFHHLKPPPELDCLMENLGHVFGPQI